MSTPKLKPLPNLIFFSRWLQLPLYLGLIVAQGVYVYLFLNELWHLIRGCRRKEHFALSSCLGKTRENAGGGEGAS